MCNRAVLAIALRKALQLPSKNTNVYRLVNGEGDRLGGLMVDVIGPVVVVQSSAYWVEKNAAVIRQVLEELLLSSSAEEELEQGGDDDDARKKTIIWRRSESRLKQDGYTSSGSSAVGNVIPVEEEEGDDSDDDDSNSVNSSSGSLGSDISEDDVVVRENGLRFLCGPESDQKTGFYCDQRDTRSLIRSLSAGCTVLDGRH
jgi:23S rRNA G2069 N7-methylase RlmK/C1962 C5-methylase RlmI